MPLFVVAVLIEVLLHRFRIINLYLDAQVKKHRIPRDGRNSLGYEGLPAASSVLA